MAKRSTKPVLVVGLGPVGQAKAAHLRKMGYKVRMWSPKAHLRTYDKIKAQGYVKVRGVLGDAQYDVKCCDDLGDALDGVQQFFVTVAAMGHPGIVEELSEVELNNRLAEAAQEFEDINNRLAEAAQEFEDINNRLAEAAQEFEDTKSELSNQDLTGKSMITIPDNLMSALVKEALGDLAPAYASGTFSSPYGCRADPDGTIFVKSLKPLDIASYPGKVSKEYKRFVRQYFPGGIRWVKSTLRIAIGAPGHIIHPTTLLTNIGSVENPKIRFQFYGEGMSEGVCNIIEANSKEMMALGKKCGYDIPYIVDACDVAYPKPDGTKWKNFREFAQHSYSHNATLGDPETLLHRYFLEDVPHGLVFLEQLARIADVDFENVSSVITLSGTALKIKFRKTGITLKVLNMEGLSLDEIIQRFEGKGDWEEEDEDASEYED